MIKIILVIIINTTPQYIQVFDDREQCSITAQLIRKAEHIESYCIPSGSHAITYNHNQPNIG